MNSSPSSASLLQFLSSENISTTLLFWINSFPLESCQNINKLTDLRDTTALSEILINIDDQFFKDLRNSNKNCNTANLWLINLVQLKKLFLKLSSYVEIYLQQDWSLLPVPDFKLAAKSEENSSHLNFMVAAVLLTATHSGKKKEFLNVLEMTIPSIIRKDIQEIQDHFTNTLNSNTNIHNSPRKSSCSPINNNNNNNHANDFTTLNSSHSKVLFPSTLLQEVLLSIPNESEEVPVSDIKINCTPFNEQNELNLKLKEHNDNVDVDNLLVKDDDFEIPSNVLNDYCGQVKENEENERITSLLFEIKNLELKLIESDLTINSLQENKIKYSATSEKLVQTQRQLVELTEEFERFKEDYKFEEFEISSLKTIFEHERQNLEEINSQRENEIEILSKRLCEQEEEIKAQKILIEALKTERAEVEDVSFIDGSSETKSHHVTEDSEGTKDDLHSDGNEVEAMEALEANDDEVSAQRSVINEEILKVKHDNSRLVGALKKARDHILNQDQLIKDLQDALCQVTNYKRFPAPGETSSSIVSL